MTIRAEVLRAMLAAGASPEMLIAAVEADQVAQAAADEARLAAKREATAARVRKHRAAKKVAEEAAVTRCNASNGGNALQPPKRSPTPPKTTPQDSPSGANAPSAPKGARSRGCRLPDDFAENAEARQVVAEWGYEGPAADEVLAEFCDFWRAVPGARGTKTDWLATLRNRLREIGRRQPGGQPPGPGRRRQAPTTTRDFWAQTARQAHETLTRTTHEQRQSGFDFEGGPAGAGEPGARSDGEPVRERPRGQLVRLPAYGDPGRRSAVG